MVNTNIISEIIKIIKDYSGICVTGAHVSFLERYIAHRENVLELSGEEFLEFIKFDKNEFLSLISQVAINETYFFREERQFDFLNQEVFPKFKDKNCLLWSAACSSGEEAVSLAALAQENNVKYKIYATDIDVKIIKEFNTGIFKKSSFRNDGKKYCDMLNPYISDVTEHSVKMNNVLLNKIYTGVYNLCSLVDSENIPEDGSVDIIFLRNVLIYFEEEMRCKIINFMEKKLTPGGILVFSMNEIPSIKIDGLSSFERKRFENVFYLQKIISERKYFDGN